MSGKESAMNRIMGLGIVLVGITMGRMLKQTENTRYMLRLTGEEIDRNLANHTFLHIGGHHRGGTTLAWDALKCHSIASPLGTKSDIAQQRFPWIHKVHHEGIFLQDVYPTFSLDHPPGFFWRRAFSHQLQYWFPDLDFFEFMSFRYQGKRLQEGIGSFALNPNSHLTETHPLATRVNAERLLNQWGSLWDFSKPLLLEKSPSNARIPRFLHSLWSQGNVLAASSAVDDDDDDELVEDEEDAAMLSGPKVRFLFMTRHPIMQAMAMDAFVDDLSMHQRVEHWLAVEESFAEDIKMLPDGATHRVQLEDLTLTPERELERIAAWLGLPGGLKGFDKAQLKGWIEGLQSEPNKKYDEAYRGLLAEDGAARAEHQRIVADFQQRVKAVSGYDLSMGL